MYSLTMPQELVIALIAAAAALGGSLLGSFLTRTTEHKQWLRNQQRTTYADFIDSVGEISRWASKAYKIEDWEVRNEEGLRRISTLKSGHLVLFAPPATLDAAQDMINSLIDLTHQVSLNGYRPRTEQFDALFLAFSEKQISFNQRCRVDIKSPE